MVMIVLGSPFKVGQEAAAADRTQASRLQEIEILLFPLVPARRPCILSLIWNIRNSKHDADDVHGVVQVTGDRLHVLEQQE